MQRFLLYIILLFFIGQLSAQDSLLFNNQRYRYVLVGQATAYTTTMFGLYHLWYKDYNQTSFHFFNDADEWLQMDKAGHLFSSYYVNNLFYHSFLWAGVNNKKSVFLSSSLGLLYISSIEVFDGFSEKWGASVSDFGANAVGISLFGLQQYYWEEQRIIPKFSFHTTQYPKYRPDALGENREQQLLKDYNGQTYWLSVNIHSFYKSDFIPKWLNVALGYSADGMVGGIYNPQSYNNQIIPKYIRQRQYYLSLDIDLTKIKTRSQFVNTIFIALNSIKLPFPTIEYVNKFKFKALYF